jgi:hypothetical protein
MYQRLTELDVAAVERGLAAGMRHAEIAREFDLSVWTIARIADRRRFERDDVVGTLRVPSSDDDLPEDDGPPDYQAQNLHRCPTCGAMIYITPCIACQMATLTQPVPPAPEIDDEPEPDEPRLTLKQRRWRQKRVRKLVLGEC